MRFIIKKTSEAGSEGKPCEEAVVGMHTVTEYRSRNQTNWTQQLRLDWADIGRNHRDVGNNRVAREQDRQVWFVEIQTLDVLLAFMAKYDELILKPGNPPTIEIYDDYRE
jgi:hypothetical protein